MMDLTINPAVWNYGVIPLAICVARITDVSLGTLRILYISKGMRNLAAISGFFEVIIWLFAAGHVIQNLSSWVQVLAFASGYTIGNYVGICIEEKLSIGHLMLRVFTKQDADLLAGELQRNGCGITRVKGQGAYGEVDILFTILKRKQLDQIVHAIQTINPKAVYTVEDVRRVNCEWLMPQPFRIGNFIHLPETVHKAA